MDKGMTPEGRQLWNSDQGVRFLKRAMEGLPQDEQDKAFMDALGELTLKRRKRAQAQPADEG